MKVVTMFSNRALPRWLTWPRAISWPRFESALIAASEVATRHGNSARRDGQLGQAGEYLRQCPDHPLPTHPAQRTRSKRLRQLAGWIPSRRSRYSSADADRPSALLPDCDPTGS
jgi:hypothetical protein